jgi:ABC-type nitrate/sulfonate/bicarbonate transport system substrate-binding protein
MSFSDKASYSDEFLSRGDPWPPVEVEISPAVVEAGLRYEVWLKNGTGYDVPGLTVRGVVPAGSALMRSFAPRGDKGKFEELPISGRGEISWYRVSVAAGQRLGPFVYEVSFSGDRNLSSRAVVERGGVSIAFAPEVVWHPVLRLYAGHDHLMHRVPLLVAREMGWLREEGIDEVEIGYTGDDDHTIAAMEKGDVDIGLDVKPNKIFPAIAKGAPIRMIAGWRSMDSYIFFGSKRICSVKDLKGKKMQLREKDGVDVVHKEKVLKAAGLDMYKDIEAVKSGPSLARIRKPALDSGDVDMISVRFGNTEAQSMVEAGYPVLADLSEMYPDGYQSRVLIATSSVIEKYPKTVKGILKGLIRAYRFMAQAGNHEEVHKLLKQSGAEWVEHDPYTYPDKGDFANFVRPTHPMDGSLNIFTRRGCLPRTCGRGRAGTRVKIINFLKRVEAGKGRPWRCSR